MVCSAPKLCRTKANQQDAANDQSADDIDKNDDNFGCHYYVHFLSTSLATGDVCDIIIDTCSSSISHNILLNSIGNNYYNVRPLHLATRNNNIYAINKLLKCSKMDPNLIDDVSGMTAVHEACQKNNLQILQIFEGSVRRRTGS